MGPEAHSLQALKGCRRCWRPGGKARFQSHWQRVCCLDVRAGRNQTWSLTAAQTETFLCTFLVFQAYLLTRIHCYSESEKYVVFGCWP